MTTNARQDAAQQTAFESEQNTSAWAEEALFTQRGAKKGNTPIARADAEAAYTTCCICGNSLLAEHLYLCNDCTFRVGSDDARSGIVVGVPFQ